MKWIMFHGLDYILLDCIKINTTNGQSIMHSSTYMDNPEVAFWGREGEESVMTESALNMSS